MKRWYDTQVGPPLPHHAGTTGRIDASATFAGSSALKLTPVLRAQAQAQFAGVGGLTLDGRRFVPAVAKFAGASVFSADWRIYVPATATFAGNSGMAITGVTALRTAVAAFVGASSFLNNSSIVHRWQASIVFAGNSTMLADLTTKSNRIQAVANFAGASGMKIVANQRWSAVAKFAGATAFSMINPRLRVRADAKFAGASAYKGDPFISGTTGPNAPVLTLASATDDTTPDFFVDLPSGAGNASDAQAGDILVIEYTIDPNDIGGGGSSGVFEGNPNKTITAINTSGGIICDRTTAQTPGFINFSANAVTATGTSSPWEDLHFEWDLGYPGMQNVTNPVTGFVVNPNTSQTGPEATGRYDVSGTYTVTCHIRGKNGAGETTATMTRQVVISDYAASGGTIFVDSAAVAGGNGSQGNPYNTLAQIQTQLGIANSRIRLKAGSSWAGAITVNASPMRIDTYGAGAKPAFTSSGTVLNMGTASDVVFSGLALTCTGASNAISAGANALNVFDIWFDNTDVTKTASGGYLMNFCEYNDDAHSTSHARGGVWGGLWFADWSLDVPVGIYSMPTNWAALFACTVSCNIPAENFLDHHVYTNIRTHGHFRYVKFDGPNLGCHNFCINLNYDSYTGSSQDMDWFLVSDCMFHGSARAVEGGGQGAGPVNNNLHFIVQKSAFHHLRASGAVWDNNNCLSLTYRDNNAWDNNDGNVAGEDNYLNGGPGFGSGGNGTSMKVYRNKTYRHATAGRFNDEDTAEWGFKGRTDGLVTFTDNVTVDMRSGPLTMSIGSASGVHNAGSIIDRNQWWAPNSANFFFDASIGGISFAQWRAAGNDINGSNTNPNWPDAGNGNFGP